MTGPKTNERPGTRAFLRGAQMSATKVRQVLDLIRGEQAERAQETLRFCGRGAAEPVAKLLASAVANAKYNEELEPEELYVSACFADEGRTMRRGRARARGRYNRISRRTAHVTIIVSRLPEEQLARLRAERAAEQAARRARRTGGRARAERARPRVAAPDAVEEAPVAEPAEAVDEAQAPQAEAVPPADNGGTETPDNGGTQTPDHQEGSES